MHFAGYDLWLIGKRRNTRRSIISEEVPSFQTIGDDLMVGASRGSCLAISAHLSEGRGPHHHVEAARIFLADTLCRI